jgi:hypothetical protein
MTISKEKLQAYLDEIYDTCDEIKPILNELKSHYLQGIIYQLTNMQNLLESGYFNKEKVSIARPIKRIELNRLEREFCDHCTSCNTFENCDDCQLTQNSNQPTNFNPI